MPVLFTDHSPATLEEAIDIIVSNLNEEEREAVTMTESCEFHHDFGQSMRNNWGLWDAKSKLSRHFKKRFKLSHADDMSRMILEGVYALVKGEEFSPEEEAEAYLQYWRTQKSQVSTFFPWSGL